MPARSSPGVPSTRTARPSRTAVELALPPYDGAMSDRAVTDLVQAAAAGDGVAWNALVSRYSGLVWSIARQHRLSDADAGDVCQATWLRLVENLGSPARPGPGASNA